MRIAVIGSGGREHAIAEALAREKSHEIFVLPGNGGTDGIAENVPVPEGSTEEILAAVLEKRCEMAVIGPEKPLVDGLADRLREKGVVTLGPGAEAARIEGSKVWAKRFMERHGIPTAAHRVFDSFEQARAYIRKEEKYPLVIKADGLAAGKGVIIAATPEEAEQTLLNIMVEKQFGAAGDLVEIEEFLRGRETSYLVFCDGETFLPMATSKDYKKVYDGDRGLNTGGMGTFSPSPLVDVSLEKTIQETIIRRAVEGFKKDGIPFTGVLYAGLMLTDHGPQVLEFNCRFGDPETQVILSRLKTPLSQVIRAVHEKRLHDLTLDWDDRAAVCVVAASAGYPGTYQKGKPVTGLENVKHARVYHAGTRKLDGKVYTSGGRVLGVTALGESLEEARETAYRELEKITFEGIYYRKDIGSL
ncbi:MAG TPA: phosphoribosylamine--glycine ligase [Candidatus Mcinerneyibacteriales bacterium]|nr:phosphoribosylamine--glycine ligase [Candidatus Mcinerneyibacteriales bacterium]